jgi:hypothetical protein
VVAGRRKHTGESFGLEPRCCQDPEACEDPETCRGLPWDLPFRDIKHVWAVTLAGGLQIGFEIRATLARRNSPIGIYNPSIPDDDWVHPDIPTWYETSPPECPGITESWPVCVEGHGGRSGSWGRMDIHFYFDAQGRTMVSARMGRFRVFKARGGSPLSPYAPPFEITRSLLDAYMTCFDWALDFMSLAFPLDGVGYLLYLCRGDDPVFALSQAEALSPHPTTLAHAALRGVAGCLAGASKDDCLSQHIGHLANEALSWVDCLPSKPSPPQIKEPSDDWYAPFCIPCASSCALRFQLFLHPHTLFHCDGSQLLAGTSRPSAVWAQTQDALSETGDMLSPETPWHHKLRAGLGIYMRLLKRCKHKCNQISSMRLSTPFERQGVSGDCKSPARGCTRRRLGPP